MPLDGSYIANEPYRVIESPGRIIKIPDRPAVATQPRRRKIDWFRVGLVIFAVWLVGWTTEVNSPNHGVFSLVFGVPTILRENDIARSILYGPDAHRLEFTVADQRYTVISPGHPLTPEDRTALLNYAARNNLPMWTADGQLAVDP